MHFKSHQFPAESNHSFAVKIENLVREIIIQNEIPYYRIESGVEHLTNTGAEGNLPVIRIITYFEDTVSKISDILHQEFDVDADTTTDSQQIRIETFAYKNLNYTATLTQSRQNQTEYKRSGDKKFEIQLCSMLQDAWTGIEKELGYDTNSIPAEAKRDFYRVGALLEMADIEFLKIRTELGRRKANVTTPAATPKAEPVKAEMPVAEPVKAPEPQKQTTDDSSSSFIAHLQAVAREVQQEAPKIPEVKQPEAPVLTAQEFSKVVPPQAEIPKVVAPPVVEEPVYVPPVVLQPVQAQARPSFEPPVAPQQPVAATPPQAPAEPKYVPPVPQPVAAQYAAPAMPEGLAPKPTFIPKSEPVQNGIASGADMTVDSLKELAQSINNAEHKTSIPPVEKQEPAIPKEQPAPIVPPAINEIAAQLPVPPAPLADKIAAAAQQVQAEPSFDTIPVEQGSERAVPFINELRPSRAAAQQADDSTQMTDVSLREFVMSSKLVKEIDQKIAERAGAKINNDIDIEGDVERLRFLKVFSLKQLHDRLSDNKDDIVAFAEKWIGKDNGGSFDSGICLFYLEYLLVGKRNDPAFAVEYVVKFISDNDYSARYIIPTYNSIHNTEAPNFSHLTLRA